MKNKFLFCCKTEHKGISKPQTPYVLEFLRVRPKSPGQKPPKQK